MALKATIKTTSDPVVSKVVQGAVTMASGISGLNVDYTAVANNDIIKYDAASNTFVAGSFSNIDGGEFNNGTF